MLRRARLSILLLSLALLPLRANALTLSLDNVQFDDGGTATGYFNINVYEYLAYPTAITTTAGSTLPGAAIGNTTSFYALPATFEYAFSTGNPTEELVLQLLYDPTTVNYDPLVTGGASFECTGPSFSCTATRDIVAGQIDAPEPPAVLLLATGLVAFTRLRRRRLGKA